MEPQSRKRIALGAGALVILVTAGLLATQAVGAFGGHDRQATAAQHAALCRPGNLTESNGDVSDGCVSFHADAASGAISAYTAKVNGTDVSLVESLGVPALAGGSEQLRRGYSLRQGDVGFVAQGPGFAVASRNGTALTIAFPADATVAVHDAVADWSPAGATVTYGAAKASLVLPKGSTLSQSGNTLTIQAGPGVVEFHLGGAHGPMGHGERGGFGGPHGDGFEGRGPEGRGPGGPRGR
ncbi:MAG: hypothetical protein QOG31_1158 [Thermoplasmata archaeon]|jgi:hypothetical protein|nr:hypothetical protein [Thermoplasmata archaeon]